MENQKICGKGNFEWQNTGQGLDYSGGNHERRELVITASDQLSESFGVKNKWISAINQ